MTAPGVSIAHHQARAEQDAARVNEIRELGVRTSRARVSLEVAEQLLAGRLYYCHEGGLAADELAAAAGLTRKQTLEVIDRYRRELSRPVNPSDYRDAIDAADDGSES